jgi:hypothetical protein
MSMMDLGGMMGGGTGVPPAAPEPGAIAAPAITPVDIKRDEPEPDPARAALVGDVTKWCRETRAFRSKTFAKMRRDMEFVRPGRQWKALGVSVANPFDDDSVFNQAYEANIVQRHVQQRVAALYAKNPKVVARRRKRLDFKIWDGEQGTLREALARAMGSPGDPMTGAPPAMPAPTPEDVELLQDVEQGMNRRKLLDRVSKTLEVLYTYFLQEGTPSFKLQAKQLIRRVETTGVGFVQLGFQRLMKPNPEIVNRIRDQQVQIDNLRVLAADLRDDKLQENDAKIEELKLSITSLQAQEQVVLREGLVFDFPASTDIIVDRDCIQLKGFVGAKRIAREYHYTKDQVKAIFGVDLGTNFTQYEPTKTWQPTDKGRASNVAVVWAVWDVTTGLCYFVCDGYKDFLREPEAPQVTIDGFFPLKVLSFNDIEDPNDIYPPSDVEIVRPMQLEYNRAREGLREHRIANKPGYIAARGVLNEEGKRDLANHLPNELLELDIPADAVKEIEKYLAAKPTVPIQPEVYDTEYVFVDFQRVAGDQAANLGGASGDVTATEASIAETSRVSSLQSCIDDVNDFLSDMARSAGQILFAEMSPQQVEKIVGPGMAWPDMTREEISEEIYLEIEAGSSGRPNKAVEIANMERMLPFLVQMQGLKPDWLLRQMMTRIDENVELEDAFDVKLPSVVAQNAITTGAAKQVQPGTGKPNDPAAQGPQGAENEPAAEGGRAGIDPSRPGPRPDFPVLGAPEPV